MMIDSIPELTVKPLIKKPVEVNDNKPPFANEEPSGPSISKEKPVPPMPIDSISELEFELESWIPADI